MAIDFESALAGDHGEELQRVAERAVDAAVADMVKMLMPAVEASLLTGYGGSFAKGGAFNPPDSVFRVSDGEFIVPKRR